MRASDFFARAMVLDKMRLPFDVDESESNPKDKEFREKFSKLYLPLPVHIGLFFVICWFAYSIRLGAVNTYGKVIHEFDPW